MLDIHHSIFNCFSNEVILDIDVLCPIMAVSMAYLLSHKKRVASLWCSPMSAKILLSQIICEVAIEAATYSASTVKIATVSYFLDVMKICLNQVKMYIRKCSLYLHLWQSHYHNKLITKQFLFLTSIVHDSKISCSLKIS